MSHANRHMGREHLTGSYETLMTDTKASICKENLIKLQMNLSAGSESQKIDSFFTNRNCSKSLNILQSSIQLANHS